MTFFIRHYLREYLKPEIYGPGLAGIFRQGMTENATLTVSIILGPIIGLMWPFAYNRALKRAGKNRYVVRYTIYRPEDSRLDMFDHPPSKAAEIRELRKKEIREELMARA